MRVRTRDNCLSWARLAREHADAGLAALIAAAAVLSIVAFDTAAREAAVSQTAGGSITMPVETRETGCQASKVNTARPAVDLKISTEEE